MKFYLIITAAAFWAAVAHTIWGFYPVTIGGAVIGAIAGALAVYVFDWADPEREPDEMEHLPNDPPMMPEADYWEVINSISRGTGIPERLLHPEDTEPKATLCWDGCGRIAPYPEVLCPECRSRYPWSSQ